MSRIKRQKVPFTLEFVAKKRFYIMFERSRRGVPPPVRVSNLGGKTFVFRESHTQKDQSHTISHKAYSHKQTY